MKKIVVLIPCYNEADGISDVIKGFPKARLKDMGFDLEILVIDNNSTDNTAAVARRNGARVIVEKKQGKGYAIRTGFASLPEDTDFVVMLDGDNTYKSSEILRLVEPIDSGFAKAIVGSRMHGRIHEGSMKPLNRFGNQIFSGLVRTAYGVPITDVLTGYFAWAKEVVDALRPHLTSRGFAIEMEMITKMAGLGYDIYSVPISYHARAGESSLNPFVDGSRILGMYVRNIAWKPDREAFKPSAKKLASARPAFYESINRGE